jgi:hypothetical protein
MRFGDRRGHSWLPMWSGTLMMLCYGVFLAGSVATTFFFLIRGQPLWPALMNVALWGGLGSLLMWRMYLPSRRFVLFHERVVARRCPSCAQPLIHDDRAGGDTHRRCSECGHLWQWPPPRMEEPYIGW